MRRTLFWKEVREMTPVLGVLAALEILLWLGFWHWPAGTIPDGVLSGISFFAAAAVGASLFAHDRRPGTLSLLFSLPIARSRILAAKLAAGLTSLVLLVLGGLAAGWLAVRSGWIWAPGPANTVFWWMALAATALLSTLLAVRVALDWPEPLLPLVAGGGLGALAFQVIWVEEALFRGRAMALLAALCAIGAVVWRLRARFEAVEDRAPRRSRDVLTLRPASRLRATVLLMVEWRQRRALLGILALLPLVHLVGSRAGWFEYFAVLGWGWLGGALVGASLFAARERDASRFLLHALPIGRKRLAAGRMLGGLMIGALYMAECLLVLWAEERALRVDDLLLPVLIFVFFYGSAFLIGAALSPWLRSTVVTALLTLISTYMALLVLMLPRFSLDDLPWLWFATGLLLTILAAVAGWSTMRSRAFEPQPRKDLRVVLVVFAVWLVIAGIVYSS